MRSVRDDGRRGNRHRDGCSRSRRRRERRCYDKLARRACAGRAGEVPCEVGGRSVARAGQDALISPRLRGRRGPVRSTDEPSAFARRLRDEYVFRPGAEVDRRVGVAALKDRRPRVDVSAHPRCERGFPLRPANDGNEQRVPVSRRNRRERAKAGRRRTADGDVARAGAGRRVLDAISGYVGHG